MRCSSVRWDCQPYSGAAAAELERELGVSPTVAAILARRGYATASEARRFLRAEERHDPFAFAGMAEACARVLDHVARGTRIVVHGDYDVDGVASTALLVRALRRLGADPAWHLPSRFEGGYGLSTATVEALARSGTGLLIAVDCGITSGPEIDAARTHGIETVVVDHHRPGEDLPDCPIVHPAVGGYPFPELCAAGVALKLAEALDHTAGEDPARAEREDLDLVALATVADLVPLLGENRRLVRTGLRALGRTDKAGLRALMAVASLAPGTLDAQSVGFRLAPRLNAAGRLGRADGALELLLSEDPERAQEVAAELDGLNRQRRAAEERILVAAEAARAEAPDAPALVLAGEGWSPGVIGIVASRMVERHGRPCVLIAFDADGGRGSGRSIPAYDLHAALTACAGHLRRYGGHRAAAGLEIDAASLDAFRADLLAHARAALTEDDLVPVETVDAVVPASALGLPLAEDLEQLGPFGQGNPRPTLLIPAARVRDVRGLGSEDQHAALTLASGAGRARVVAFGSEPGALRGCVERPHEVAARLEVSEWNGVVEPQLLLRALCESEPGECEVLGEGASLWEVVERELGPRLEVAREAPAPCRELHDHRGEGFAGTVGDLVSREERVLVVCTDVARRRNAVEQVVGGLARSLRGGRDGDRLALVSWEALEREPQLARPFPHLVALDPPDRAQGERLLVTAPAPEGSQARPTARASWGRPEVDFALRAAHARLDVRRPLAAVYRSLREPGESLVTGQALEQALRGEGQHPRDALWCARLMRVLVELELVSYVRREEGGPACRLAPGRRTELERSATHRDALARLEEARRYLEQLALRPRLEPLADARPPATGDGEEALAPPRDLARAAA